MKSVQILITLLVITLCVFGAGFVWFLTHIPTPELLATNQKIAEKRADIELMQAKEQYNQSYVQAQRDLQRLEQQKSIEAGWLYNASAALSSAIMNLWPAWAIASVAALIWQQRARWTPQVQFAFDGIVTTIPADKAVELTQEAIKAKEFESSSRILALQEENAGKRFKESLQAVKLLKGMMPVDQPGELLDVTPESLPAFTGPVYLSQCRQDGEFDDSAVCWGRNIATGGLVQIPFEILQSLVKNGLQGQGKSAATLLEIYAGFYQKYLLHQPIKLHLIDRHHGFDESLSNRLEAMLPGILSLFDTTILGPDIDDRILAFLQEQIEDGKRRQEQGSQAQEPIDVIVFDEYTETVSSGDQGKAVEEAVKTLFNYRKAKKYLSLVLYETTKNRNSAKGLNPAKLGASKICFACAEDEAGRFIGWSHAKAVEGLDKGQCAIKLTNTKEVELVQLAIAGPVDFFQFAPFISQDVMMKAGDVDADSDEAEPAESDPKREPELTPEFVKAWIEERKIDDPKYSQNKLAEEIGFSRKDLSWWMNGKSQEPKQSAMETALETVIFGPEDRSVINMKQWREHRRKAR